MTKWQYERASKSRNKKLLLTAVVALVLAGLTIGSYRLFGPTSLVPKSVQHAVSFPIYYPNPKKLPAGYILDMRSFRTAQAGVVLFAVTYDNGKKSIVFSEEQQPSAKEINAFVHEYIPVNTATNIQLGQAKFGAYGTAPNIRTVVSLPVTNGPWLIITAQSNANHGDLVRIVQALVDKS